MNLSSNILKAISKGLNEALVYNTPFTKGNTNYYMVLTKLEENEVIKFCDDALDDAAHNMYFDDNRGSLEVNVGEDYDCIMEINGKKYCIFAEVSQDYYVDREGDVDWSDPDYPRTVSAIELDEDDEPIDNIEYTVYMDPKYLPKDKGIDRSSELCKKYDAEKAEEKRIKDEEEYKKRKAESDAYENEVRTNREKYKKMADDYMEKIYNTESMPYFEEESYAEMAEHIYNILGLSAEAENAHRIAVWAYHKEEGNDI